MDNRVIHDLGVIRISGAQLVNLAMQLIKKRCKCLDLIDVEQPEDFTSDLKWTFFEREQE